MGLTHPCKLCTCMPATTSINIQHAHVQFTLHKNFRNKANKKVSCKNIHKCRDGAASHYKIEPKYIIIIYILGPRRVYISMTIVYNRVIKNRVRAPTHHTGNKSPDTKRGSLASLAIHNPCRSQFIAFKRLCIHCTQVNILRLQVTLKPLSPSLHLATSFCANYSSDTIVSDI